MKTYARVDSGVVSEIFSTDSDISDMFHPALEWVDVSGIDPQPAYGWAAAEANDTWSFSEPAAPAKTVAELKAEVLAQRDALLAAADEATAGMSDAFVAGLLDDADTAMFKVYAAYKLILNKVDKQVGYPTTITWPAVPVVSS